MAGETGTLGRRGESCLSTDNCEKPLVCVNQTCSVANFEIEVTDKACQRVECEEATDCCPEPNPSCKTWKDACDTGAGGANQVACDAYNNPIYNCICDTSVWACDNFECIPAVTCAGSFDCIFGVCSSEKRCVECEEDTDCLLANQSCVDNACVGGCENDTECPVFHACESGACSEKGCQNDRECVALSRNPLSSCDLATGSCSESCETDADCSIEGGSTFTFRACVDSFCKDVGCQTDEECKIRLLLAESTTYEAKCLKK
jgi:hypothetical protein